MNSLLLRFLVLLVFSVRLAWADTVTLRNNTEINGKVSYQDGTFAITARYSTGIKTAKFDRAVVRTVEINSRDFNPGEPPKDVSIFLDRSASTRDASDQKNNYPNNKRSSSERPTAKEKSAGVKHSVLGANDFNPSTDDVLWLRNKNKLTGRLIRIDSGQLRFEQGQADQQYLVGQVATILIAPN